MELLCASVDMVVTLRTGRGAVDTEPAASELTFERIYEEHFGAVERWIRALGGRGPDVADLAQEVFIVAFRRFSEFDGQNVTSWLYQITRRKLRDSRSLSWTKHLFTNRNESTFEPAAMVDDQLKHIENNERQALLKRVLNRLPAEQRAAFVLFELDGLTGAEIAEIQQVPINTVWARIHRARYRLQTRTFAVQEVTKHHG